MSTESGKRSPYSKRAIKSDDPNAQKLAMKSAFFNDDRLSAVDRGNFRLVEEERNAVFLLSDYFNKTQINRVASSIKNVLSNVFTRSHSLQLGIDLQLIAQRAEEMDAKTRLEITKEQRKIQQEAIRANRAKYKAEQKLLDTSLKIMKQKLLHAALILEKVKRETEAKKLSLMLQRAKNQKQLEESKQVANKAQEEVLSLKLHLSGTSTANDKEASTKKSMREIVKEQLALAKQLREEEAIKLKKLKEEEARRHREEEKEKLAQRMMELQKKEQEKAIAAAERQEKLQHRREEEERLKKEKRLAEEQKRQEMLKALAEAKAAKENKTDNTSHNDKKMEEDLNSMFNDLVKKHDSDETTKDVSSPKEEPYNKETTETTKKESSSLADKFKSIGNNENPLEQKPVAPLDLEKIKEESERQKSLQMVKTKNRKYIVFLIKGEDRGKKAWYYLKIEKTKKDMFIKAAQSDSINLDDYGEVIYSAYGEDPPEDIQKKVHEEYEDVY